MLGDRIKEVVDFAKSESPYRSANKGWITNDVFLKLGTSDEKSSEQFDQFVKISFLWQPIIQAASILFVVIFLASLFAFTPISLSNGRLHNLVQEFILKQELASSKKTVDLGKSAPSIPATKKKVVTATDLFQPRHS